MSESNGGADGGGSEAAQYSSLYTQSVLRRLASLRSRGLSSDQISHRIVLTHPNARVAASGTRRPSIG